MYYDRKQLERDLGLLVQVYHRRRQVGFYTETYYERNGLEIDQMLFGHFYHVRYKGLPVDLSKFVVDSEAGLAILNAIIHAEENTVTGKMFANSKRNWLTDF